VPGYPAAGRPCGRHGRKPSSSSSTSTCDPDAVPLIISHGWPGSIIEFLKVIGPLTDPTAHGGDAADAFRVVCPSLPGYGFSGKPDRTGWGKQRIADAWAQLMARLGYLHYGAQGGDWGSAITDLIGQRDPDHVVGIHFNLVTAGPHRADLDDLTDAEQAMLAGVAEHTRSGTGYSAQQSTRSQTLWNKLETEGDTSRRWSSRSLSSTKCARSFERCADTTSSTDARPGLVSVGRSPHRA